MKRQMAGLNKVLSLIAILMEFTCFFVPSTITANQVPERKYTTFIEAKQSAESGEAQAQFELAGMYARGDTVAKDERQAFEWSLKAAKQGHPLAQGGVGVSYMNGIGVEKNTNEGVRWLTLSAEQGHDLAMTMLGMLYLEGYDGLARDEVEAGKWFLALGLISHDDEAARVASAGLERLKGLSNEQRQEASRRAGEVIKKIEEHNNRKR